MINKDRTIIILLTLILFSGVLLIERGITGMYLVDFPYDYCDSDQDCSTGQVCCDFYGENSGVCDGKSNCEAIEQITKQEKEKISSDLQLQEDYEFSETDRLSTAITTHLEQPKSKNNYPSIIAGAVLLILGIIWIIYLRKG